MRMRNHSRNDGTVMSGDTVEVVNSDDAQQNGVYTVATIAGNDDGEFALTLVSQSNPGFVTSVLINGEPVGNFTNHTLQ